ncbi:MAG: hypothetical protein R3D83_10325 [Caenibius sp.]
MNPDALDLLAMVARFLDESLSSQVPPALRSDVRAAAKNLVDARAELDAVFPLLMRECDELGAMVKIACDALGQAPRALPDPAEARTLTALKADHAALLQEVGDLALLLQARDDEAARATLAKIFAVLRDQAGRRLEWQSVFPPDRLVSDVLRETWPVNMDDEESAGGKTA